MGDREILYNELVKLLRQLHTKQLRALYILILNMKD